MIKNTDLLNLQKAIQDVRELIGAQAIGKVTSPLMNHIDYMHEFPFLIRRAWEAAIQQYGCSTLVFCMRSSKKTIIPRWSDGLGWLARLHMHFISSKPTIERFY